MWWFRNKNRHSGESRNPASFNWTPTFVGVAFMMAPFFLSGCGFESLYATRNIEQSTPAIEIANIPDQDGQYLRNLLIDRLNAGGRPADPRYELKFTPLAKDTVNIGIRKDASATRAQVQVATQMRLIEKSSGKILLQRDLKTVGAYNLLDNQLATMSSQRYTTENILRELGDSAVTELDLYFRRSAS
jgi:LPS-assembly lipoprotein